jgi:hypothetical protein
MTGKSFDHKHTSIHAKRAVIDVVDGWMSLNKHFADPSAEGIPVLIKGVMKDDVSSGDIRKRQFDVAVEDLFFNCDHTVVRNDRIKGGSHFDLCADTLERLDSLAESTIDSGLGYLASANYHAQGQVAVPSHWLRALVSSYRTQHPETALFYYHLSEQADADGSSFIKVVLVSRDHWEQHKALEGRSLAQFLGGRVPHDGVEAEGGVFVYREVDADGLRSELHNAGFREDDAFSAFASALGH